MHSPLRLPGMAESEARALLHALQSRAGYGLAGFGRAAGALHGRHVVLVAADARSPSAQAFTRAAQALGAQVAQVRPSDLNLHGPAVADTLRMLARLYSAIGCAGLDRASLALLRRGSALPVLHDLAAAHHPLRVLADLLTLKECAPPAAERCLRLGIVGRPRSRLLHIWRALTATQPLEVKDLSAPGLDLSAPGLDGASLGCDFLCLPQQPPLLLALDGTAAAGRSLQAQQWRHHQRVVQAALCRALDACA